MDLDVVVVVDTFELVTLVVVYAYGNGLASKLAV